MHLVRVLMIEDLKKAVSFHEGMQTFALNLTSLAPVALCMHYDEKKPNLPTNTNKKHK